MYTGPHLIKDGLVFGYDTGYGIADNNTGTRFYPGEPTVNSLASTAFGYSGITLGSDSGGTYLETNSSTSGYNYIKVPNITVSSNETYTWSFELKSTETITQSGNKYYFDTNEYSNEFSNSNDQSRVSSSQVRPSSLPANEWVKFALTVTMKPNLTGAYSYDFLNFIKPHFTSKKIYYRNMQFEHNKSYHTPFVDGTRSSTQSLIDLKRTTDIDVSNVSFDSTGQPEFDGTDDYFTTSGLSTSESTNITFETVIRFNGTLDANDRKVFHWDKTSTTNGVAQIRKGINNGRLMYQHHNGTQWYTLTVDDVVVADTFAHITVVHNGTTATMYKNGVQIGTTSVGNLDYTNAGEILLGYRAASEYWKGNIPVFKVYKTALSASEIKQNFNAYKNRFNI